MILDLQNFIFYKKKITYIIMEYYTAPLKVKVMLKGISKFDRLVSKKFPPLFFLHILNIYIPNLCSLKLNIYPLKQ